jgi:hypothetical protein
VSLFLLPYATRNQTGAPIRLFIADFGGPVGRGAGNVADGFAQTGVIQDIRGAVVGLRMDGVGGWMIQSAYPALK